MWAAWRSFRKHISQEKQPTKWTAHIPHGGTWWQSLPAPLSPNTWSSPSGAPSDVYFAIRMTTTSIRLWHNFLHCLVSWPGYQLCAGWTFCLVCFLVALFSLTAVASGPEQVLVLRKQSNISWTNDCNLCSIRSFCRRIKCPSGAQRAACTQFTRVSWSSFLGVPLNYCCYIHR